MKTISEHIVTGYVDAHADRLIEILRDLVQIPSVNHPPSGEEGECQDYVLRFLEQFGWNPQRYLPSDVPGITEHPLYWKGRDYQGRPNVRATRRGHGGGRSLILSGHIDTVPVGTQPWHHSPFGATVKGNRIYGRGAVDMKGGVAANLFVAQALSELDISLPGDLTIETVVDEEFGGVNGTLAGRLAGVVADAAVISEPSFLRICPAQRGGRTVHIAFENPSEGILSDADSNVAEQLRVFLNGVSAFREQRLHGAKKHPFYQHLRNPVPVTIARIYTADWGYHEPPNNPDRCQVEMFWQAMPGESVEDIDREFFAWFDALLAENPRSFPQRPSVTYPYRWLPGSSLDAGNGLIEIFGNVAEATTGERPVVQGIEGPCDMFVFHEFGIPAVLWGARGANLHQVDEYVEIDSVIQATKVLLAFVLHWCGEGKGRE